MQGSIKGFIVRWLSIPRVQMLVAAGTLLAIGLYAVISWSTINEVKIRGPYYTKIVQGKDLVADILPPPAYILESYLTAFQMLYEKQPDQLSKMTEKMKVLESDFHTRHDFWRGDLEASEMKKTFEDQSYPPAIAFYEILKNDFIPAIQSGDKVKAEEILERSLKPRYEEHRDSIDRVVKMATDQNAMLETAADRMISHRGWLQWAVFLIALVGLTCFSAYLIQNGVNVPIRDVALLLNSADLNTRLNSTRQDSIGQLSHAFDGFVGSVKKTVDAMAQLSSSIASAAEELTSISHEMGAGAEQTSSQANVVSAASEQVNRNVQTVAAGIEEMSASVKEIAKNASQAANVASSAVKTAEETNATVGQLGDSSAEIGNVVNVITSIAEQTNLLALNATIEAARAGEAGKGFAVVANEVKELAKQTGDATQEISQKISGIQATTKRAVDAIAQILQVINQINDYQTSIASAVEEQSATTNEIGRNVSEVAKASADIAGNILGVAQTAQSTSRGAKDTQGAASELSKLAANLQGLVAQFSTDENRVAAAMH